MQEIGMRLISSVALVGLVAAIACAASLALGEGQIVKAGIETKAPAGSVAGHVPLPSPAKQAVAS
jgi:hypothetical protein